MHPTSYRNIFNASLLVLFLLGTQNGLLTAQKSWSTKIPGVGSFSSPRIADLNLDGTGDIIMGAGREEFQACDSAVIALDGKTGKLLWHVAAEDQIFGSAIFKDIDADGIEDIFIGGRSAELIAISGGAGKVIWRFSRKTKDLAGKKSQWFNFYNPQFIPDQDGDGLEDLLVSNGGNVLAAPHDANRPAGRLIVLSSRDGRLLADAQMPDGKEIYMSITVVPAANGRDHEVIFGTGGETVGGNLFVGYLSDILRNDLSKAKLLDNSPDKGYIAPSARVDVTGDGVTDIVNCSVDGRLLAYDGRDHRLLWETVIPSTEAYSSVAVGYFNQDSIPDFFISYARGVWPNLDWSQQHMINGQTGAIEFTDSLGFYQMTSPVAFDYDGDGWDEVLMSVNIQEIQNFYQKFFHTMLVVFDFQSGQILQFGPTYEGNNLSSTPWVGDLDNDGRLDIIYCHGDNLRHTYTFDGIKVHRIATQFPIHGQIEWGAYQGSHYDGTFKKPLSSGTQN